MKKIKKIVKGIFLFILIFPISVFALSKDETVYTNLTYQGKFKTSTVVNKLAYQGEEEIVDETELKKILNINGKEKYVMDGNTLVWKSSKKDIYYQGSTNKELPITVKIKYYLDGKKISAKKLKGKKGQVKVVMNFQNHLPSTYQNKTVYTPFVVTVGTILDSKNATQIEVENGKVIDTGTKSMVVALASPGLYDSLGIQQMSSLNQVSFTYHTNQFQSENIYVVATPKLLEQEDLKIFDKMDQTLSKVDDLQKGTDELQKGSRDLANGTSMLKNELENKISELHSANNSSLSESARNSVTYQLKSSLSSLVQNTVYNVVKTKVNATKNTLIDSGVQTNCAGLSGDVYQNCIESVKSSVTEDMVMTYYQPPTYQEISTGLDQVFSYYLSQGGIRPSEENKNLALLVAYQVSGILSTTDYAKYILAESSNSPQVNQSFQKAFQSVISSYGMIASNVAVEVANQATLKTIESLQVMYRAVVQIDEGATKISFGVNRLNESGIHTLSGIANQYKNYNDIIKELKRLDKEYKGFVSNNSKNTKFIYKIQSIK